MSSPLHHHLDRSRATSRLSPSYTTNGSSRDRRSNTIGATSDTTPSEELGSILVSEDRAFTRTLNARAADQEKLHHDALAKAQREHEFIRATAERARQHVELQIQKEMQRREYEENRAIDDERRKLEEQKLQELKRLELDQQKKAAIDREKLETEQRIREEARRDAAQEAARKVEQEQAAREAAEAKVRRENEEAEQREKAEAAASEKAQQQQQKQELAAVEKQANGSAVQPPAAIQGTSAIGPPNLGTSIEQRDAIHRRYLDLHKRLKAMREHVRKAFGQNPQLKEQLSDWRRTIKSRVGQTNKVDKLANKQARESIDKILSEASRIQQPSVDIAQFIVSSTQPPTQGSGVLLFLLNHFAKAIISQMTSEIAVDTEMADSIGILTTWTFSKPEYCLNGISLIDILWAKYHVVCPPLFGISGSEQTSAGRQRLGWAKDDQTWVSPQEHFTRMTGLGAGFAAITLRDFSKARTQNPAPNRLFWQSLARIVNLPPKEIQPTHFILAKNMVERFAPRIIAHFGQAGIVALRKTLVDLPQAAPRRKDGSPDPVVLALDTLALKFQNDLFLAL